MYMVTTKRDYMGRLVAMKLRRVVNTWNRPDPYMFVDHAGNIHDNVGPDLPAPQYKESPFQIILRFSTNEDVSNPVIRCVSVDNEAHVLSHDDSEFFECDLLSEWQCLCWYDEITTYFLSYTDVSVLGIPSTDVGSHRQIHFTIKQLLLIT